MICFIIILIVLLIPSWAQATVRYVDTTLSASCTSGNYSISARACTGTDGNAYTTIAAALTPTVAGDTLYLRTGNYSEQMNLQDISKSGTSTSYITIGGMPGEAKPVLNGTANGYGLIKSRGAGVAYIVFQDLVLDGVNLPAGTGLWIAYGNHHLTLRRIEIKNQDSSGIYIHDASDILIEDSYVHDARSDCAVGNRWYAVYQHHGNNVIFRRNTVENMPGGAYQSYPGPSDVTNISGNVIKNVSYCQTSQVGGIGIYPSAASAGGLISNLTITDNVISHLGYAYGSGTGGAANAITIDSRSPGTSNVLIANNTVYDLHRATGQQAYGVLIRTDIETSLLIKNNLIAATDDEAINNAEASAIVSYNACLASKSCGSTGKVTIAAITDCTISTSDFRLKQGTNSCRNAGTSSTSRTQPVDATDIGAYEQGRIASAAVVGTYIEATMSVTSPGVQPTSGLTGFTAACVGCTGTPVVSSAVIKAGTQNVIQLTLSGISASGTCTISLGSTNATDTYNIGGPIGIAQGVNSVSGQSVSGTCANSSGGGGGGGGGSVPGGMWSEFRLDEGSGTTATDSSGAGHTGTVSAGVTWVTGGITIPTDSTYRHVSSTYGSAVNPSTQDFTVCAYVLPDVTNSQKVVFSSGTNGTNQRWYAGWYTIGGQPQWGIGVQSSGFTTGSEFVAVNSLTLVCLINDATADTATLSINGVMGVSTGFSIKSLTSYTLTNNLVAGNDGTNTINNGGFTIYEFWVWDKKLSSSEVSTLYASLSPAGTGPPCLSQSALQFQRVYTKNGSSVPITAKPDGSLDVVSGGAVAVNIQLNCTTTNGESVSLRPYYSTDGVNFLLPVPSSIGAGNIGMWGPASSGLNLTDITTCISPGGLTQDAGFSITTAVVSPTLTMTQNHCVVGRWIFTVGAVPGTSFYIRLLSDTGAALANGYAQTVKINVVSQKASGF